MERSWSRYARVMDVSTFNTGIIENEYKSKGNPSIRTIYATLNADLFYSASIHRLLPVLRPAVPRKPLCREVAIILYLF